MRVSLYCLVLAALVAFPVFGAVEARELHDTFEVDDASRLHFELPVGEVKIEGSDRESVEVRVEIECKRRSSRCEARAEKIRLDSRRSGGSLHLAVEGFPKSMSNGPQVEATIFVPRNLAVYVEVGVGELEIAGLENDVEADLGVGEVDVTIGESAVKSVHLDVGVGDATLRPSQPRAESSGFLFLGNEIDWEDGEGRANVVVDVGVGEAEVRLDSR